MSPQKANVSSRRLAVLGMVLSSLAFMTIIPGASAGRRAESPQAEQTPQYEVSVVLKLVQVYVVDKKGNPVPNLTAEDFELYDNGELKTITEFEKHAAPAPAKAAEAPAKPSAPPEARLNRKYFLFFDFRFNDQKGAIRAKNAGLHFIDTQLQPSDEVAIISCSSLKGFTLHEYLTKDHAQARQSIEQMGLKAVAGRASEIEYALNQQAAGPPTAADTEDIAEENRLQGVKQEFSQSTYRDQVLNYLQGFRNLGKAFRYVPGAKTFVLFSGGIARSLVFGSLEEMGNIAEDPYKSHDTIAAYSGTLENLYGDAGIQNEFKGLAQELKAANASIYGVNVTAPRGASTDRGSRDSQGDEFLRQLSKETGGRYFHNTQDSNKAVEDIQNLTSAYYVLGYKVDEKWDGKFHEVKVTVKQKGYQVWGTSGYFNPKPFAEYTDLEKHLQLIDMALSENPLTQAPVEIPIKAVAVFEQASPRLAVLTEMSAEMRELFRSPRVDTTIFLFDEQMNLKGLKKTVLNLSDWEQGPVYLSGVLPTRAGRLHCRVVMQNMESGRCARASAAVNVPLPSFSGLKVDAPLWLRAEKDRRSSELISGEPLSALYPFSAQDYVPLINTVPAGTQKIWGVVRLTFPAGQSPDIQLAADIVDSSTGTRTSAPLAVLNKSQIGNINFYFVEVSLGELAPKAYSLNLLVQEKFGSSKTLASNFTVR